MITEIINTSWWIRSTLCLAFFIILFISSISKAKAYKVNSTRKPTSSSPTHTDTHEYPPEHAVDGNTNAIWPNIFHSNCSDNEPDWWRVDLQEEVISPEVTIYFRVGYKGRRNGVRVTLSLDPVVPSVFCHCVHGAADGSDIADVYHLNCPGRGQFLTISTDTDNEHGQCLDFGEVEVQACSALTYGENCDRACVCGSGESCDPKTGDCFTGSQPAWPNYACVSNIVDAKGKPTSASSALDLYGHEKAVDGIVSAIRPNVFQTDCTDSASDWWRVDLQEEVISPQVTIYFRVDGVALGGACNRNEQCIALHSQCFGNICKCTLGYSVQPQDNSCVDECDHYGKSMTLYPGTAIIENNAATLSEVATVDDCLHACVTHTDFRCISIDYLITSKICHLQKVSFLDAPTENRASHHVHGNRDCKANVSTQIIEESVSPNLRRNGVCVSLSSDPVVPSVFCHCVDGAADGSDIPEVYHLNCSGRGQFLTISTDTDNGGGQCLEFGEVEVHACSAMTYGTKCDRVCACNANDGCDPNTGECFTAASTPGIPQASSDITSSNPLTSSLSENEMTTTMLTPLTSTLSVTDMTTSMSTPFTSTLSETDMTTSISTRFTSTLSETDMTTSMSTPLTSSLSETDMTTSMSTPFTSTLSETDMTNSMSTPFTSSLSETDMTTSMSTPLTSTLSETDMTTSMSTPFTSLLSETDMTTSMSTPFTSLLSQTEMTTSISTPFTSSLSETEMTTSMSFTLSLSETEMRTPLTSSLSANEMTTSLSTRLMAPSHVTSVDLSSLTATSTVVMSSHSSTITAEATNASEGFTVTSPTSDTTTTPDPTVLSVDKYGRAVRTKCSCRCKVPSLPTETKAAEEKAVEMKKALVVKTDDLSKTKAKKESKKDARQSSSVIGQSALVIVVIPVVLILLPDFISVFKGISAMMAKTRTNE